MRIGILIDRTIILFLTRLLSHIVQIPESLQYDVVVVEAIFSAEVKVFRVLGNRHRRIVYY